MHFPSTSTERDRATGIIHQYGKTVLARFALFEDKRYFFSPGGSVIAYVLHNRTAVALGDPIGPPEDNPATILGFQKLCHENDWQPCFYQTLPDFLSNYRSAGMHSLKLGEEAIVDLAAFTLQGGAMKPVRTSVNKFERLGYACQYTKPPHSADLLDRLEAISNEWMIERHAKEMKFSMGWFDRDYLNTTPVLTVADAAGNQIAFVNLVDEYQNRELAVDLMRHQNDMLPGTMDYLFASMLKKAQELHYERFNLGLSGLVGVGESSDDPAIERAMHFIYSRVKTTYNFRGLHEFKEKFLPGWSPRYLIYPNLSSLPAVALALNEISS
jgi:phosphatidylglycerol lysyltransferase